MRILTGSFRVDTLQIPIRVHAPHAGRRRPKNPNYLPDHRNQEPRNQQLIGVMGCWGNGVMGWHPSDILLIVNC